MAGYGISAGTELPRGLLSGRDGLAKRVETVLNQVLEARGAARTGGPVALLVPQTRDGSFPADIFKRYRRSGQDFVPALMEMVAQGVSTRKVPAITEALCGAGFSKPTVGAPGWSRGSEPSTNGGWKARIPSCRPAPCSPRAGRGSGGRLPCRPFSASAPMASAKSGACGSATPGVPPPGGNLSPAPGAWPQGRATHRPGRSRRPERSGGAALSGRQPATRHFQGASRQRCRVHPTRDIPGRCGARHRAGVAAAARLVLQAPDPAEAKRRLAESVGRSAKSAPKAAACLEAGFGDATAAWPCPGSTASVRAQRACRSGSTGGPPARAGDPHLPQRWASLVPDRRFAGRAERGPARKEVPRQG